MTSSLSSSWYKPGQTSGSVLGEVSSSFEECRAETVALYREFGFFSGVLYVLTVYSGQQSRYFGHLWRELAFIVYLEVRAQGWLQYKDTKEIQDLIYITFLLMARAGLRALEFYDPKAKKHLQAHMQARSVFSF